METMNALPKNDQERIDALRTIYMNAMQLSENALPFAPEMLGYIKPILSKLNGNPTNEVATVILVRQVVDELIFDIYKQMNASFRNMNPVHAQELAIRFGVKRSEMSFLAQVA